jgi:hypothetical protein
VHARALSVERKMQPRRSPRRAAMALGIRLHPGGRRLARPRTRPSDRSWPVDARVAVRSLPAALLAALPLLPWACNSSKLEWPNSVSPQRRRSMLLCGLACWMACLRRASNADAHRAGKVEDLNMLANVGASESHCDARQPKQSRRVIAP